MIFAAEAASRGALPFMPVGQVKGIDMVLITSTGRTVTAQIKAQGTRQMKTVDLVEDIKADVLAVCHLGVWYLLPAEELSGRTVNVKQIRNRKNNWDLIR